MYALTCRVYTRHGVDVMAAIGSPRNPYGLLDSCHRRRNAVGNHCPPVASLSPVTLVGVEAASAIAARCLPQLIVQSDRNPFRADATAYQPGRDPRKPNSLLSPKNRPRLRFAQSWPTPRVAPAQGSPPSQRKALV